MSIDILLMKSYSTGYSAKYTTYSFQDDETKKIAHFELVQVNILNLLIESM